MKRTIALLALLSICFVIAHAQYSSNGRPRLVSALPATPCVERDFAQVSSTHLTYLCQNLLWVKVATGTAGATITAGANILVKSNGTDGIASTLIDDGSTVAGTTPFTNTQTIAAASTDGIVMRNATAAANGAQQWSPRLRFTGAGFRTSGAVSFPEDWIIENQTVQASTSPGSNLVFSQQANSGGYSALFTFGRTGNLTATGTIATNSTGILNVVAGKTLTVNNTVSIFGTDAASYTLPSAGIIAGTQVSNSFTQTNEFQGAVTFDGDILAPNIGTSSAATTGTVCWTTGTGLFNVDTTTTCLLSSAKYKDRERPLGIGLDSILKLKPVSYFLKAEYNPTHLGEQVGLLAEDVANVDPRLISTEKDGSPHAVRYQQLTAVLVKAIQEQQSEIELLKQEIDLLKKPGNNPVKEKK